MKWKVLGLLVVGLLALPSMGHATLVTISGQDSADGDWNVTTVSGTFLPASYDAQPWWGSKVTAEAFAVALGNQLAYPNVLYGVFGDPIPGASYAPVFGYAIQGTSVGNIFLSRTTRDDGASFQFDAGNRGQTFVYAVAERATISPPPVPLPAAAWLLLSGLGGLGLLRKRKAA